MASLSRAAAATAGEMGRHRVTVDDLALVCLRERAAARVLGMFDVDGILLAGDLDQTLSAATPADEREGAEAQRDDVAWDTVWDDALTRRRAFTASVNELDLLLSCLMQPSCAAREALTQAGVSLRRFALVVAHGPRAIEGMQANALDTLATAECAVILWNDRFTPLDRAADIVAGALDVDADRALALVSEVDARNCAAVYRGPIADARAVLARLEARAIDEASALYAELVPLTDVFKTRGG